jgi:hypothetical protein
MSEAPEDYVVTLSDGRTMTMEEFIDMIRAEYDKHALLFPSS